MPVSVYGLPWHVNHADYSQNTQTQYLAQTDNSNNAVHSQFIDESLMRREQVLDMKQTENDTIQDRDKGSHSYFLQKRMPKPPVKEEWYFESETGVIIDILA
jgi:hypothetical protein